MAGKIYIVLPTGQSEYNLRTIYLLAHAFPLEG